MTLVLFLILVILMLKVLLVIAFLIGLCFVIQGFVEVATAPDLFEQRENSSAAVASDEVEHGE